MPIAAAAQRTVQVKTPNRLSLPRPERPRRITIANQKDGVDKTASTVNIASVFAQHDLKVLVIDNDPQGNASTALGIERISGTPSTYEFLTGGLQIDDTIQRSPESENLFYVPVMLDLAGSEIKLVSLLNREHRLLDTVPDQYLVDNGFDFLVIDCPPSLNLLALNSMTAANEILIPIQCGFYALEGVTQLMSNVQMIRQHLNPELHISAVLLTMFDGRTKLSEEVVNEVRNYFSDVVPHNLIPRSMRVSEAPRYPQTIISYDPGPQGVVACLDVAEELVTHGDYSAVPGGNAIGQKPTSSPTPSNSTERD